MGNNLKIMTHHSSSFYNKIKVIFTAVLIGVLLLVVSGASRVALAQTPITAQVDRNALTIDEQLVLTVTITGDFLKIPRPDLSQLQDFVVASSSTSTQVSIVNGKMTSQGVFNYRLQPLREGQITIASISVNIDGQLYQTEPIQIEVLPSGGQVATPDPNLPETNAPNTLQGQDFFVEAEVDNSTPYLGEQVIYTFRIYQAINFPPGQPDYTPPAFTDFWSSEILAQPHYNTKANGRDYLVTEILTALFPANLGSITIEPASLVIPGGLLSPDIRLETNSVTLDVRPLPEGAPEGFSGAVGQFEIRASLNERESKVNEPLTLVVEIEGAGNIQTLQEPKLPELPNWRFFESQDSTATETGDGLLRGKRTFERLIVPGQLGEQTIPPISFSYYDPELDAYQTINTEPIVVTILPDGSGPAPLVVGQAGLDKQPIELAVSDIRHIKSVPSALRVGREISLLGRLFYWSCWIFPLLLVGGAQLWQNRRQRLLQDAAYARHLRARRVAFKILNEAQHPGSDHPASAAGRALSGYLSDKLNTPTAGLTTDNLIKLLRRTRLETALIEQVEALLREIDIGRFAPIPLEDGESTIMKTRTLINDLEKAFSKRKVRKT
jgi:hypothetical protein